MVVDVNRELRGLDAITAWAGADIFAAQVHFDVLEVIERQGRTIVSVEIDGTFDRTGLPDPLVTNLPPTMVILRVMQYFIRLRRA